MTTTTRHTTAPRTAAQLHADILAAAAVAPEFQNHEITQAQCDVSNAAALRAVYFDDGLMLRISHANFMGWRETQGEWLIQSTTDETFSELASLCDQRPSHVTFKTATGRLKLVNTKERLQGFADGMAKSKTAWQLWGGGNMPAELAKPKKAKPATIWQTTSINVCVQMFEDKLHADGLAMALDRLGGRAYWHNEPGKKNEPFLVIAPQPVVGLPERLASGRHAIGGAWVVFDTISGLAVGTSWKPARSRAAAERIAINLLNDKTPEQIEAALQRAKPNDNAEALARLCQVLKIEDTAEALAAAQAHAEELAADAEAQHSTATDQVADVVAEAMAAAAIDAAQESAAAAELAQVAHTQADTVADVVADVAEMAEVAEPMAADVVAELGHTGAPGHGTPAPHGAGHATPAQRSSSAPGATGGTGGAGGQRIAGKSGRWVATFHSSAAGLPAMVYTGPDGVASAHEFDTGSQRMAALQRMAREADTAPAKPAAHTQAQANHTGTAAHVAGVQQASAAARAVFGWTVDQVQAWTPAELAHQVDQLESINHHTAALALHCLRAGRVDLATECERIEREHMAAGRLTEELSQARQAVAAELKTPTRPHTPHPAAPQAAEAAPVCAAGSADYTHPLKTSEQDYTHPLKTPGALAITITRGEGPSDECGKPHTVASFAEADALLLTWADTVRPGGSCDKVDFSISWPDGSGYAGCYELQHHTTARPSLARHMVDMVDFYTGKGCPAHMSEAAYLGHMQHISADTRAAYEEAARQLNAAGIHTGKARPVSCDLRDLVTMGLPVAELVGLGVTYCGDAYTEPQTGAIVAAEAIEQNPRFYRVGLMGRDARPDLAAVPQIRVTVRTECGAEHTAHHDNFGQDVGARYRLDMKRHGAPYLAQLAAAVAMRTAQATAAKELEAKAHAEELARLAVEFAHLERTDGHGGGVFAARNIRTELKRAFPGVKFSVKSDYSSVGVRWTDGPTDAQVSEVIGRFDIGASDPQSDYFYTVGTAFSELFGGVQYLNTYRDTSDEFTAEAIAEFWAEHFTDVANAPAMPTPADWRNNTGFFDWRADNWQTRQFREHLNAKAGPMPTTKTTRKAKA